MAKGEARRSLEYDRTPQQGNDVHQVRVLLADDNPAVVEVVGELLQSDFLVVGSCGDGKSVLRDASTLNPDVVVLDISLGDLSGIEVAKRLLDKSRHIQIVFLTVHESAEFVRGALAAGGAAYVFKSRLNTDLIPAIESACSGNLFISRRSTK
jgi:DNA-binding NarL/FixJ family response regulator